MARAASLYCEAALAGNAEAQFSLGWMYANGRGVDRDDGTAAAFFALAAAQGHDYAQRMFQHVGPTEAPLPESWILEATAYLNMCHFDRAKAAPEAVLLEAAGVFPGRVVAPVPFEAYEI